MSYTNAQSRALRVELYKDGTALDNKASDLHLV